MEGPGRAGSVSTPTGARGWGVWAAMAVHLPSFAFLAAEGLHSGSVLLVSKWLQAISRTFNSVGMKVRELFQALLMPSSHIKMVICDLLSFLCQPSEPASIWRRDAAGGTCAVTLLFPAGDCRPGRVWAVSGGGSYLFFLVSFNRGYGEGRGKVLPVLGGEGDTIFSGLGKKSLHASNRHSDHFSVAEWELDLKPGMWKCPPGLSQLAHFAPMTKQPSYWVALEQEHFSEHSHLFLFQEM